MAATQVQALLRFLSQDAKLPLATAIAWVKDLQRADLRKYYIILLSSTIVDDISKSDLKALQDISQDEKTAKQVLNAAKRAMSKKRTAPEHNAALTSKKAKRVEPEKNATPSDIESALSLPSSLASEEELSKTVLLTNRAPLVLAFAVSVTKYTMPEQPISSRLSLAQAVVSANSRTKAVSLGIASGKSAEEEGWGQGQPVVKILGRNVKVLKRWDYDPKDGQRKEKGSLTMDSGSLNEPQPQRAFESSNTLPPLWGLDLEAAPKFNERSSIERTNSLPIHTAESVRAYLLKSFTTYREPGTEPSGGPGNKSATPSLAQKERCLGLLLRGIDIVCESWSSTLSADELDRRAWAWYLHVRPDVQPGAAGWGEKGQVKLSDILNLRRRG
ncbi:hypothetical protein Egran_03656 [Elaphomyces granulatus]|uniref:Uncharacterized protein n=1 Tax=Elaphomyces granulatus TaxID=519963 RepID=A0A232LWT9_9EURO|nr:hypothetical protein Egran_03656 [Elaphomyces granulatus]